MEDVCLVAALLVQHDIVDAFKSSSCCECSGVAGSRWRQLLGGAPQCVEYFVLLCTVGCTLRGIWIHSAACVIEALDRDSLRDAFNIWAIA
eukprot:2431678-Amphidinium_carterae.1